MRTEQAAARNMASVLPESVMGEVTPAQAWDALCADENAMLIDVRTLPEWQFVGMPDLSAARGKMAMISWKLYPGFALNTEFEAQLRAAGAREETPFYFICRSGGRSMDAALAMIQAGFSHCFNVLEGFEGEPDSARRRGVASGWKAAGLPWSQS